MAWLPAFWGPGLRRGLDSIQDADILHLPLSVCTSALISAFLLLVWRLCFTFSREGKKTQIFCQQGAFALLGGGVGEDAGAVGSYCFATTLQAALQYLVTPSTPLAQLPEITNSWALRGILLNNYWLRSQLFSLRWVIAVVHLLSSFSNLFLLTSSLFSPVFVFFFFFFQVGLCL